jgi:hypothetical protein
VALSLLGVVKDFNSDVVNPETLFLTSGIGVHHSD